MNCNEIKYYLKDYAEGHLIEEVREEIKAHLLFCLGCCRLNDEVLAKMEERGELAKEWEKGKDFGEERDVRNCERGGSHPYNMDNYRQSFEKKLSLENERDSKKLLTALFGAMVMVVIALSVLTIIMYTFE